MPLNHFVAFLETSEISQSFNTDSNGFVNVKMGNSGSIKLNQIKKDDSNDEIPPKSDIKNTRFESRMLPPIPNDKTDALSEPNYYDPIRGIYVLKI